jgi:CheY-like chemotaxis protein
MNFVQEMENPPQWTVVIADDEPDDLRFAKGVIAAASPQLCIRGVASGNELISYLIGENRYSNRDEFPYPTLVLLDLRMPGLHGFQVLDWLRHHPPHNDLPVVVLTASGEPPVAQHAYELGARSFLTKPIKVNEVKEIIATLPNWIKPHPLPANQMDVG